MTPASTIGGTSQPWTLQQTNGTGRPSGGRPPGMNEAIESASEEAGLDSSAISELLAKLKETADAALERGDDPKTMRHALDSVLAEAGIDAASLHEQLAAKADAPRSQHGPPPGSHEDAANSSVDSTLLLEMLRSLPNGTLIDSQG